MSRRRIVLVVLVVGLMAVAAVAATVWPRLTTALTPPCPEAERQMRAAVLETLTYGRWDAKARKLADLGTMAYDDASACELTLRRIDGARKVIDVHGWMDYSRGIGVHPFNG